MRRLLFSLIVVVIVAVLGFGWLASKAYESANNTFENNEALTPWLVITKNIRDALDQKVFTVDQLNQWPQSEGIDLSLLERTDLPLPEHLELKLNADEPVILSSETELQIHFQLHNSKKIIVLTLPITYVASDNDDLKLFLTLIFYVGIVATMLAWLYPLLRQLAQLEGSALAFGAGQLTQRIPKNRWSYIETIECAFNRMADHIQALLADNKMLSQAVSHDLKTPLARLRFGFEILGETRNSDEQQKYLARINQDLTEMESLVVRLLEYAKLEENHIQLALQEINLNTLITRVCELFEHEEMARLRINLPN